MKEDGGDCVNDDDNLVEELARVEGLGRFFARMKKMVRVGKEKGRAPDGRGVPYPRGRGEGAAG